jgi:Icc-related predicted phosphoesterase
MRILAAADLHGRADRLSSLQVDDVDLIAICGDLHNGGTEEDARPVAAALANLGPPVLIVPGNMDPRPFSLRLWGEAGLVTIHRRSYLFGDVGFVGMGGMAVRSSRRLADEEKFYHRDEDVYEALAASHRDILSSRRRIVLTHQPPLGALDTIYTGERTGCPSLRRFIEEYRPTILICGHIHESRGQVALDDTLVVNAGELREGHYALIEVDDGINVEWARL